MKSNRFPWFRLFGIGVLLALRPALAQAVEPPELAVRPWVNHQIELSWPAAAAGFVLEETGRLAPQPNWSPSSQAPVPDGGRFRVVINAPEGPRFFRLRSTVVPLTTIASSSPANRETGVAVTRTTSIRFTGPLDANNPLNGLGGEGDRGIYAEHNGVRLPATAELSADGLTVTLSYQMDLPAAARIQVTVNGSLLNDALYRLVDADGRGSPGGVRVFEFETADNRPPDTDGDGIEDLAEATLGTDPAKWDTDEDGFSDGQEREAATDPLSLDSRPGIRLPDGPGTVGELMAAFPTYGPFAVGPDAIAADGQILSRLEAVLNPQVTPAIVYEALDAVGVRIVTMRPGMPFVTLALPPRPGAAYTPAEIEGIAQQLVVNSDLSPFLFADPAFEALPELHPGAPGSVAALNLRPQDQVRLPAAWNLRATPPPPPATPVRVLVPDFYVSTQRHPQLWVQRFIPSRGGATPTENRGNHGFAVASAIAADFDDQLPTGAYPTASERPADHLEILSLPLGGLGLSDVSHVLMDAIVGAAVTGQASIVSTSLGYHPSNTRVQRIRMAFQWRQRVLASGRPFLHVASAGNSWNSPAPGPLYERLAEYNSPWNLAARRGSLDQMLFDAPEVTGDQRFRLQVMVDSLPGNLPGLFAPLENVVIVGSIDADGARSPFSEPGEDVVVQGSGLALACMQAFPGAACDGTNWVGAAGTSFSTPQVAGVAAYLLTQKPDLTPTQLRAALLNTRAGAVLDAYGAVLELDAVGGELLMRKRLLDVAGGEEADASGAQPDGKFDERDLESFVNAFSDAEALREPGDPPDRSRFDLNGDGYTGGPGTARFILDPRSGTIGASFPRTFSINIRNLPVVFDEEALTDFQILCFYAYAGFYTGSPSERGRIIGEGCCPVPPLIAFRSQGRDTPESAIRISIHIINAQTGSGGPIVEGVVGGPAWRPDGGELAYWQAAGGPPYDSVIIGYTVGNQEAETTPQHVLVDSGGTDNYMPVYLRQPTASGDQIFFVRRVLATGSQTPFIGGNGRPRALANYSGFAGVRFPAVSSGQQESVSVKNEFAYVFADGLASIRTVGPSGGDRLIATNVGTVYGVAWSPDGQSLAFGSKTRLQLVSNQTLEVRTLATNGVSGVRVSWSPDGRYIAYEGGNPATGKREIYAFDLTGGPLLNFGPGEEPAWSPDGKEIAFRRDSDVWVHTIATGAERQLTFTPNFSENGIVWRPGSKTEN